MRRSAVALALAVGLACSPGPTPPVPLPDLTGVEDEVRRSVESTRALLLDDTTRPESWFRLGERYRSAGWNDEAAVCYREAQRLEPEHFRWAYLLGHALMESDPPAAAAALDRKSVV